METSKSVLNPITEKLEDIAEKIDKERIESEAKWEKSQRELEEVNFLLFIYGDLLVRQSFSDHLVTWSFGDLVRLKDWMMTK